MKEIEEISINAGLKAAKRILEVYESDYKVNFKEDNSPVTIADIDSSRIITKILSEETGLPVISEEIDVPDYSQRKSYDRYFLIDPLDGTKEFVNRTGEFCVNIALVENNIPSFGLIVDPKNESLIYGGAFSEKVSSARINFGTLSVFDENVVIISDAHDSEEKVIVTSRRADRNRLEIFLNQDLRMDKFKFITKGSALKFVDLALGKADIYPRFGNTMEWDIAPGYAILNQLNGSMTELRTGNKLEFNKENLLNPPFIAYNKKLDE